jgi:multiple sugar transport system ATP-binding protein
MSESLDATAEPSERGNDTHILIEDLRKTFDDGSIVACDDITLQMDRDEFVVLLGPSGCGKTTTLRCLSGLEQPDSGDIYIDGEDVTFEKPKDRDLAFVFQSLALFPHMTVQKNIEFGLDMKTDLTADEKDERVQEVAEILEIGDLLDKATSDLSGGEQQRVALGRAMVMEPKAFLLDEPFSNLDANLRDQMQTEVQKLHRQLNTTMVFVTHDQEEAMTLGDKIVVLNDGSVMQVGSARDIYDDPANEFVAQFIGSPSTNFFEGTVETRDGDLAIVTEQFEIPMSPAQRERFDGESGTGVSVAIRPEYVTIESERALFEADVTLVEAQGARDTVHLSADGIEFRCVTDKSEISDEIGLTNVDFETEEVWLFSDDGRRLL